MAINKNHEFEELDPVIAWLEKNLASEDAALIKGSHSLRMDRIVAALEDPRHRISAIVTFLVVASGIVVAGIGSAFWGLLAGGLVMAWLSWRRRSEPAA